MRQTERERGGMERERICLKPKPVFILSIQTELPRLKIIFLTLNFK